MDDHQLPYGIVTSSPRPYCERVVKYFSFNPQFCVCYHDTKRHKPHPAPIRYAINQLQSIDEHIYL